MTSKITAAERPWLEGFSLRRQAVLVSAARDAGFPEQVVLGLAGWLAVKAADLPDRTNGSTRARYRRLLRRLGPPPGRARASTAASGGGGPAAMADPSEPGRDLERLQRQDRPLEVLFGVALVDARPLVRIGAWALLSEEPALDLVGEASSAASAMELLRSSEPDLVLLDSQIEPGATGVEVAAHLKQVRPEVHIVLFNCAVDTDGRCCDVADACVPKPSFGLLLPTVRLLLRLPLTPDDEALLAERRGKHTGGGSAIG
ncbi:MAG: response regulator [Actinomycetota bacterium]|nr:response regulator [Actinomycetota bacterium]